MTKKSHDLLKNSLYWIFLHIFSLFDDKQLQLGVRVGGCACVWGSEVSTEGSETEAVRIRGLLGEQKGWQNSISWGVAMFHQRKSGVFTAIWSYRVYLHFQFYPIVVQNLMLVHRIGKVQGWQVCLASCSCGQLPSWDERVLRSPHCSPQLNWTLHSLLPDSSLLTLLF